MKPMSEKRFTQLSGTINGWYWSVRLEIGKEGGIQYIGFDYKNSIETYLKTKVKCSIRARDRQWVMRNIPSSIWWGTEIHHNWKDGGRMYLLSKGEHILRHKKEG